MRRLFRFMLLSVLAVIALRFACGGSDGVRIATWNIRDFPESDRQVEAAFEMIRGLGVSAIAVQEITDPARFEAASRQHFGLSWRCAWPSPSPDLHVGVAFDSDALDLLSTRTYRETVVYDGARPAFEVRLRERDDDDEVLRLIVVHLKAGADGVDLRRRQLDALRPILVAAVETGERVVLLGDFNATSDQDRAMIKGLADATELEWASDDLDCTSYWQREDGCRASALDHVLASDEPEDVVSGEPCGSERVPRDRCPAFYADVSDHCPVVVDL